MQIKYFYFLSFIIVKPGGPSDAVEDGSADANSDDVCLLEEVNPNPGLETVGTSGTVAHNGPTSGHSGEIDVPPAYATECATECLSQSSALPRAPAPPSPRAAAGDLGGRPVAVELGDPSAACTGSASDRTCLRAASGGPCLQGGNASGPIFGAHGPNSVRPGGPADVAHWVSNSLPPPPLYSDIFPQCSPTPAPHTTSTDDIAPIVLP